MTETETKPAPLHSFISLACYESITNSFILCSNRIALRDNVLKGYHAAADAWLQSACLSLDKVSTSWFIDINGFMDGHGIRAV